MGTTRKNASGMPTRILQLKDMDTPLIYGGHIFERVGEALCFGWQDNNLVSGMTTAFSLHKDND